jgi:hypothetical protein
MLKKLEISSYWIGLPKKKAIPLRIDFECWFNKSCIYSGYDFSRIIDLNTKSLCQNAKKIY